MGRAATDRVSLDWEKIGEFANLEDVVRVLPPERVMELYGVQRAIEVFGSPRLIKAIGLEKVLGDLLALFPREEVEEMLRRQQKPE